MSHQRRTNSPTTPSHSASVATRTHLARWRRWWWTGGGATWHFISEQKGLWLPFFFSNRRGGKKNKMPRLITIHHHHQTIKDVFLHRPVRPHSSVSKRRSFPSSSSSSFLSFFGSVGLFPPPYYLCVCVPSAPPPLQRLTANCLWEFLILSRGKGDKRKLQGKMTTESESVSGVA
jgi:hypothetical protein